METQFHLAAALTTVLLLGTAAVSATVQLSQFQDASLDDRRFVDNVLFVTTRARSRLDCAHNCASYHGCVTFTYRDQGSSGPASCRGHSTTMVSGSAQDTDDGAKTYSRSNSPTFAPPGSSPVHSTTTTSGPGSSPVHSTTTAAGSGSSPVHSTTTTSGPESSPVHSTTTTAGPGSSPVHSTTTTSGPGSSPVHSTTTTAGPESSPVHSTTTTSGPGSSPVHSTTTTSGPGSSPVHSTTTTSGPGSSPDHSSTTTADPSDPCATGSHTELDDYRRDVNHAQNEMLCDRDTLAFDWYRFLINGSSASMPTHCPSAYRCGTSAPMWLDLQNATLPSPGQETLARACAAYSSQCCYSNWDRPVTVHNCGRFYVYNLQAPKVCYLRYCAELSN